MWQSVYLDDLINITTPKNQIFKRMNVVKETYLMAHYNIIKLTHTFNEFTSIIFNAAL